MRHLALPFAALVLFLSSPEACLKAQSSTVSFRVFTEPAGARFAVDGIIYTTAAAFQWPVGSKHYVRFVQDAVPSTSVLGSGAPTLSPVQLSPDGASVYTLISFSDANSVLIPGTDPNQFVTADASIPFLKINVSLSYRVLLNFFDQPPATIPGGCGAPGAIPATELRVGVVYINTQCYWNNAILYFPAGMTLTLNAFPFPGFVFNGWSSNLGSRNGYLTSYVLNGPITLAPMFQVAKRVRFETAPPGLQVLVDRTPAPTLSADTSDSACPHSEGLPVTVPSTIAALCRGDFDFLPGSVHLVGAPTPQYDLTGNLWVFDSWGSGQGQNAIYVPDANTASPDKVLVKFVPGVKVSFVTNPPGLKLKIDGRDNWPGYNFVWASGSTHQVSAPAEEFDSQGRKFTFRSWSNAGAASQTVTLDAGAPGNLRMVANYDGLARVVVQTTPGGMKVQIDGTDCLSPCSIDRPNGAALHIAAPASVALSEDTRLDFNGWSDGGASDHTYTLGSDAQTLTASYTTLYRLTASADPGNSVAYSFDPVAPDLFYPASSQVNITAQAKPGFKFRRWDGDLAGTFRSGTLAMSRPHSVLALMDRVPYIAPAGVRNAAGATPDGAVAAGSLVAVTGESLAPREETGRVNPLAQSIAGVTVTLGDRLLPLVSVAPQQVVLQLPSDLPEGNYTLQLHSEGQPDVNGDFTVARNAPGLFTATAGGVQYGTALHQDGTAVTPDNPAKADETITLLGSGFGPYATHLIDGFFPLDPAPALADPVQLWMGDAALSPSWAGAASGYTGITAIRFKMTGDIAAGSNVELKASVNGKISNTVMLPMQ